MSIRIAKYISGWLSVKNLYIFLAIIFVTFVVSGYRMFSADLSPGGVPIIAQLFLGLAALTASTAAMLSFKSKFNHDVFKNLQIELKELYTTSMFLAINIEPFKYYKKFLAKSTKEIDVINEYKTLFVRLSSIIEDATLLMYLDSSLVEKCINVHDKLFFLIIKTNIMISNPTLDPPPDNAKDIDDIVSFMKRLKTRVDIVYSKKRDSLLNFPNEDPHFD
jgi:hypothetical protein